MTGDGKMLGFDSVMRDLECLKIFGEFLKSNYGIIYKTLNKINKNGFIYISGVGKSGLVAQRLSSSLRSISVRSSFVHATEWTHGDLGLLKGGDTVIFVSHSGETIECINAIKHIKKICDVLTISISSMSNSQLSCLCDHKIYYNPIINSDKIWPDDSIVGAPTCSIIIQEAISNLIINYFIDINKFTYQLFIKNHPSGKPIVEYHDLA